MGEETVRGLRTRRHAMWLGVVVFPLTTVVIFALGILFALRPGYLLDGSSLRILRSFTACVPLALLVGMVAGFDAHRYATGARLLVGPLVLLVFAVPFLSAGSGTFAGVLIGVLIFSAFQWFHRFVLAGQRGLRFVAFLVVYSLVILSAIFFAGPFLLADTLAEVSSIGLLYSDALVVGWVNLWARSGMLDTTQGSRLQFSLRALLMLFAAWGLYLTLLAKMFPGKLQ